MKIKKIYKYMRLYKNNKIQYKLIGKKLIIKKIKNKNSILLFNKKMEI